MRKIEFVAVAVLSLTLFAGVVTAQKKTPKRPVKKPSATKPLVAPLEVRTAREKVEIQRDNIIGFADKLGPIAQSIEILDASAAARRLSRDGIAKNELTKQKFIAILRNIRNDLSLLESEFRTKPVLKKYLTNVEGIMDMAVAAEDLAITGKFVASKDPLREITKKLTDALVVIPR